jgi:hypothetical protein
MSKKNKIQEPHTLLDRYYVGINQKYIGIIHDHDDNIRYVKEKYKTDIDPYIFRNNNKLRESDRIDVIYCEKDLLKDMTAAWLVHVIYSSGNTFEHKVNGYWSLVALFPLTKLNEARELSDYLHTVKEIGTTYFTTSSGRKIEVYHAWTGQFDTLEEVRTEKVNLNDELAYII